MSMLRHEVFVKGLYSGKYLKISDDQKCTLNKSKFMLLNSQDVTKVELLKYFTTICKIFRNSWWCFPFEAMESLSVHLMWVAAATYCAMLAPKSLLATLIGVLGMAHFSLGKELSYRPWVTTKLHSVIIMFGFSGRGSGSFGGGLLIASLGTREAFRYMGLIAFLGGVLYGLLHYFWLRKISTSDLEYTCTEQYAGMKPLRRSLYVVLDHRFIFRVNELLILFWWVSFQKMENQTN